MKIENYDPTNVECFMTSTQVLSKYLDRKQRKAESESGFHQMETSGEKHSVSIGSGLFLLLTIVGGFLTNLGTRESQLNFLLPIQLTFCSLVFPVFIIFSNVKLRQKFLQNYPTIKSIYKLFVFNSKVIPIYEWNATDFNFSNKM